MVLRDKHIDFGHLMRQTKAELVANLIDSRQCTIKQAKRWREMAENVAMDCATDNDCMCDGCRRHLDEQMRKCLKNAEDCAKSAGVKP